MRACATLLFILAIATLRLTAQEEGDGGKNDYDTAKYFQNRFGNELKGIDKKGVIAFVKECANFPRFSEYNARDQAEKMYPFTPGGGEIFLFKLKSGKSLAGKVTGTGWQRGHQFKFNNVEVWSKDESGIWSKTGAKGSDEGYFDNELAGKEVAYSEKNQVERRKDYVKKMYADYMKKLEPRAEKLLEKIRKDFPALGEDEALLYLDISDKQTREKYLDLVRKRYENLSKPLVVPMREAITLVLDAIAENDAEVTVVNAKLSLKSEIKARAEAEAKVKAEAEAKAKEEAETKAKEEAEAKARAEKEAKEKTEAEAKAKALMGTDSERAELLSGLNPSSAQPDSDAAKMEPKPQPEPPVAPPPPPEPPKPVKKNPFKKNQPQTQPPPNAPAPPSPAAPPPK